MSAFDDDSAQFTGKYENAGRAANWLIDGFFAGVGSLLAKLPTPPTNALEVGCGAGFSTARLARMLPTTTALHASEFGRGLVAAARRRNPGLPVARESVYALARASSSFDVVFLLEVLEHLERPDDALAELARVSRGHVVLSTPREPLWRALNMARGKYLGSLGNTPGHINHWSSRALGRIASTYFEPVAWARPVPWTILLLRPRR